MSVRTICRTSTMEPIDPEEDLAKYYEFTADDEPCEEYDDYDDYDDDEGDEAFADFLYSISHAEGMEQYGLMYGNEFTSFYVWAANAAEAFDALVEEIKEIYGWNLTERKGFWVVNMTACLN